MIAVIDYKAGNLTSVMKAVRAAGADAQVTGDPDAIERAEKIILPGVGHFAATELLRTSGMEAAIRRSVARGVPFLGICVGLQWLFEGSTEAPEIPGFAAFGGHCQRFSGPMKVPHVGWNSLRVREGSCLLAGVPDGAFVYYTHSYRAPVINDTVAVTEYDGQFSGAVERGALCGVQFHPEKSGETGLRVLRNFLALPSPRAVAAC
ncbi:MAG: imidazole glycerol phosphate synthase subunit HisH [Acidobacteriaceae bacterium]